jgi:heptosyltransferase-2
LTRAAGEDCLVLLLKVSIGGSSARPYPLRRYLTPPHPLPPPVLDAVDNPADDDGSSQALETSRWAAAARFLLTAVPQTTLRRLPGRETFTWTVEETGPSALPGAASKSRAVVVKRFAARSGCPAREEFQTLEALRRVGLSVPEPLAWAAADRLSVLVLDRVVSTGHLGEALARADAPGRRALGEALLDLLGRFHGELWYHRDLYLSHILVSPEGRLTLIDAGRVRRADSPTRARRWFAKDMAALAHSAPQVVSRAERLRFLALWLERTGRLDPAAPRAAARRILRSWARDVERRRRTMAAHRPRHGEPGPYAGTRSRPRDGSAAASGSLPTTIVRLPSWVGDAVMAEPVLRALFEAHRRDGSQERLTLLGPAPVLSLFTDRFPGVRRAVLTGRERPADYLDHDLALFLNGSLASVIAARRARVRLRCGWADGGRAFWLTHPVERHLGRPFGRRPDPVPFTAAARALGECLGLVPDDLRPRLVPAERARVAIATRLRAAGLDPAAPFLLLNGGGRPGSAKAWPAGHWAELVGELGRTLDLPIILTTGPGEEAPAREASERAQGAGRPQPALLLDPVPDLEQLTALSAAAALVIGTDSGPAHIASAVGTPSVVIMGPTDPRHTAEFGAGRRVLRVSIECSPCQRERCPLSGSDRERCMVEIQPSEVVSAAKELLHESAHGEVSEDHLASTFSPPSATRPSASTQSASNPFVSTLGKTPSAPVRSDP